MATSYNPNIITNGLVLCLDPGNTKSYSGSGSSILDISGSGNNFTLNGSPYINYGYGKSLTYSGAQTLSSSFTPSNTWSISMWFNNTSTYNIHNRGLFSTYASANFNGCYVGTTIAAANSMRVWYNSNSYSLINYSFNVNTWYHLTITCDGTTLTVYVNGVSVNSIATATTHANTLAIGQTRFDNNYWIGNIGQTLVYNRALTAAEVAQNYNSNRGRIDSFYSPPLISNGLILHLDANNPSSYPGSGTTWTDLSGQGNHHTIVGSPTFSNDRFTLNGSTQGFSKASFMTGATNTCTVVIWYSTTDTMELWVKGNQNGSYYLSAAEPNYISGAYYHNLVGSPTNYVDLNLVTAPTAYRNGAFHMWEAKNVDFSNWTYYEWFLYGSSWQMAGNVAAILVYNRALTAIESSQNFNALRGRFGL